MTGSRVDARTQALEAAIDADPDDAAPYLIYADWIQTLGDPRGELIVAQHASKGDARWLLEKHASVFLGSLAPYEGYVDAMLRLRWFCGFIAGARIMPDDGWTELGDQILDLLIDHPSARWLRELAIDIPEPSSSVQRAVGRIAARPRPHLGALDIGNAGHVDLAPLWPRVPALRRLVVRGDPGRLGALALPALAELVLHGRDVLGTVARSIADAACPALRRLELRGSGRELGPTLHAIVHGTLGAQLSHLVVNGWLDGEAVCRVLAGARLPALRELQVTRSNVTRTGAEVLAQSQLALDILDVSYNAIPSHVRLDRVAKLVVADKQWPRY